MKQKNTSNLNPLSIQITKLSHRGQLVWLMSFPYKTELILEMKKLNAKYSKTYTSWHLPCSMYSVKEIESLISNFAQAVFPEKPATSATPKKTYKHTLSPEQQKQLAIFQTRIKARGYSTSSLKTYSNLLIKFLLTLKKVDFSKEEVEHYIVHTLQKANFSNSTQRQFISALKLFIPIVGNVNLNLDDLHYPKRKKPLPTVLSISEIKALLHNTTNLKHKTIICMLYSTGMRRGELLHLKINDINPHNNTIHIRYGKGGKDRIVPLSKSLKTLLQNYYDRYLPRNYVFEGIEGEPYSASSVAQILIKNAIKARIPHRVTPHTIRHTFATHLLESGVSLRYIQVLLGHHSSRTTEIYTKVSTTSLKNIANPLDVLVGESSFINPFK